MYSSPLIAGRALILQRRSKPLGRVACESVEKSLLNFIRSATLSYTEIVSIRYRELEVETQQLSVVLFFTNGSC